MSFVKNLAQGGLFGLAGRAIAGKDKKDRPSPVGSLTTQGMSRNVERGPSLLNQEKIY